MNDKNTSQFSNKPGGIFARAEAGLLRVEQRLSALGVAFDRAKHGSTITEQLVAATVLLRLTEGQEQGSSKTLTAATNPIAELRAGGRLPPAAATTAAASDAAITQAAGDALQAALCRAAAEPDAFQRALLYSEALDARDEMPLATELATRSELRTAASAEPDAVKRAALHARADQQPA